MNIEWIISSGGLILLVLLVRALFKKRISPGLRYALWLVVVLRLLFPFSISGTTVSILNLLPKWESVWERTASGVGQVIYEKSSQSGGIMTEFGTELDASEELIIDKDVEGQEIEAVKQNADDRKTSNQETSQGAVKDGSGEAAKAPQEHGKGFFTNVRKIFTNVKTINMRQMLGFIWALGAGICGCFFLIVNVDYSRRLRNGRKRIETENLPVPSIVPVYEAEMIQTPCLFGVLTPAIYVTEDVVTEEQTFRFVLCHENSHYIQRDHWWAFLRLLCLCVHWFNPLVWLAVGLSKCDGEMACDERTLKMLGDKARVDYGKTLLELSAEKVSTIDGWRISTAMSGNARQMKERLGMIVDMPVRKIGVQIFVMVLVAALAVITFTGKSRAQESENMHVENEEDAAGVEKDRDTEENTDAENNKGVEEKIEFYKEITPVSLGGKEYELWSEGHTNGDGYYIIDAINLVNPEKPEQYVDTILMKEISRNYWDTDTVAVESRNRDGGILTADLNFDGWNDLCFEGWMTNANVPYYCMLWNPEMEQYEFSTVLCNVEVDEQERYIVTSTRDGGGQYSTTYYRYDENNQLHMSRYVEENLSPDAVFEKLDLTYVEDKNSIYMLPAVVDGEIPYNTLISMAKQALAELYQWTGQKVDTACFEVSNMGGVFFGMTPEDVIHSRTFYDRTFGADTEYNLSGYDKSISSMYITSGRSVWYSPVLWQVFPKQMDTMTDEEIIIWYLEQTPMVENCIVKSIEKSYTDTWTIQTKEGVWFDVSYDTMLKEIGMVTGPYPDKPVH